MITSPTLVLDKLKVKANIQKMVTLANQSALELRPHFKTHQSLEIGKWFRDVGVQSITVSSLKMAEYFANDGWKSITIAFPVNILEVDKINELASNIDLRILVTDEIVIKKLDSKLSNQLGVYIELDPDYNRSGIPILNFEQLKSLKKIISNTNHLHFEGFYTHAGHSYKCRSRNEVRKLNVSIFKNLRALKKEFNDPICYGDTPSCSILSDFEPVSQLSPGNFVFYDWTQFNIGSCTTEEIAVSMYCPVVAKYPERNELLIHGGAVHFSKDSFLDDSNTPFYGIIAEKFDDGWGNPVPGNFLKSISQEHGVIACTQTYFDEIEIGDVIPILPIHSCLTADLMGEYLTLTGQEIDHMNKKIFR